MENEEQETGINPEQTPQEFVLEPEKKNPNYPILIGVIVVVIVVVGYFMIFQNNGSSLKSEEIVDDVIGGEDMEETISYPSSRVIDSFSFEVGVYKEYGDAIEFFPSSYKEITIDLVAGPNGITKCGNPLTGPCYFFISEKSQGMSGEETEPILLTTFIDNDEFPKSFGHRVYLEDFILNERTRTSSFVFGIEHISHGIASYELYEVPIDGSTEPKFITSVIISEPSVSYRTSEGNPIISRRYENDPDLWLEIKVFNSQDDSETCDDKCEFYVTTNENPRMTSTGNLINRGFVLKFNPQYVPITDLGSIRLYGDTFWIRPPEPCDQYEFDLWFDYRAEKFGVSSRSPGDLCRGKGADRWESDSI